MHVNLTWDSKKEMPWRESVWRLREALELLTLVEIVESVSKGELPWFRFKCTDCRLLRCHTASRYFLLRRAVKMCMESERVSDVEVHKTFIFAFDESSLRDEFRLALGEIYNQLTPEIKQEVKNYW